MNEIYVPSTIKRLFACGIDQAFMMFFYIPFAKTFMQVFFSDEDVYISLGKLLVMFMVPAIYEFVFLVVMQATPGKWLLDLKVVPATNAHGELHIYQCILRPLTQRLSFFFSWAIYALAFFRYDRTHLADWVAETRVIQFTPRATRPRVRWVLGSLLIVSYLYQGLSYSAGVLQEIDWSCREVELRSILDVNPVGGDWQVDMQGDDEE